MYVQRGQGRYVWSLISALAWVLCTTYWIDRRSNVF